MEDPVFKPVSASMKKTAIKLEDTERTLSRIQIQPIPEATTDQRINKLFLDHWFATRLYSDQDFIEKLLIPMQKKYGGKILTLEQLETQTGRQSTWRPTTK